MGQLTINMRKIFAIAFLILLSACNGDKHHDDHSSGYKEQEVHKHEPHDHNRHGSANEHMHKSSVGELIERFESPERDEYQKPDAVLDYLGDISAKTIMDIGAGSGYFSVKLAEMGANVIAADVEEGFLNYIEKRILENDLQNIELRKIPYDSPGLQNEEADMVFLVNTYHHIENRSDYFSKVKSGTKEDGELIIIDFFKTETPVGPPVDHKIAIDVIIAELKEAGYRNFDINVELLPYQFIIKAE